MGSTIDVDIADAETVGHTIASVGVDMDDVDQTLEDEGEAAFQASYAHALGTLDAKRRTASTADIGGEG